MELPRVSDIVISTAGHDNGKTFIVLETREDRVLIVDGKTRKLESPKSKSLKHIRFGKAGSAEIAGALREAKATDRFIRRELAIFRSELRD